MRILTLIVAIFLSGAAHALESKVLGFADYEFGMTLEQASSVRNNDKVIDCAYPGIFKCVEYKTNIYGEVAKIIAQVGKSSKKVDQIVVQFDRMTAIANSKSCSLLHNKIFYKVLKKYGGDFENVVDSVYQQYLPDGGKILYSAQCINDDQGMVVVAYTHSEGL
jgi:hypothetical protein